jgi:hypothetical protein
MRYFVLTNGKETTEVAEDRTERLERLQAGGYIIIGQTGVPAPYDVPMVTEKEFIEEARNGKSGNDQSARRIKKSNRVD